MKNDICIKRNMKKIGMLGKNFMMKVIFKKSNIPMFIAAAWAICYFVIMLINYNDLIDSINTYFLIAVCFFVTAQTLIKSVKERNNSILLYGALGLCCLTLGNLYYVVLSIVSKVPDYISIGKFSLVCCFLFFLSALTSLKSNQSNKRKLINAAVNIVSIIATITCACSVIINSDLIMYISILLLDSLCVIVSISLLRNATGRYFASVMLALTAGDIISGLNFISIITLFITAFIPVLYLLLGQSLITLKAGEQNE